MIRAKNYETVSKFVKVMTKIPRPLFSGHVDRRLGFLHRQQVAATESYLSSIYCLQCELTFLVCSLLKIFTHLSVPPNAPISLSRRVSQPQIIQ